MTAPDPLPGPLPGPPPDPPPDPPYALLAELTHRCPLACPYCSNPLALEPRGRELDTATWKRVLFGSVGQD